MEEKPAPVEEKHLADTERVCRAFFKSFDLKQIFFKEPRSPKIPKTGSRQHGFQCPFNPSQIATYLIFLYDLGTFFCINMTVLSSNTPLVVILGLAYVLNSAVVVFFAILATKSDPTDPTVYEQRYTESLEERFQGENFEFCCNICDTHVLPSAKHCGSCNRCVNSFDHHCRYINNCVGQQNYQLFFNLICSVFFMSILHNLTNGFSLYYIMSNDEQVINQSQIIFGQTQSLPFIVCLWVAVAVNLAVLGFLGHLISFHIYLRRLGLTTFEYIRLKDNNTKASKIVIRKSSVKVQNVPGDSVKDQTNAKVISHKFNAGCTDVCAVCPTKKDQKSPVLFLDLEKEDESKKNTSDQTDRNLMTPHQMSIDDLSLQAKIKGLQQNLTPESKHKSDNDEQQQQQLLSISKLDGLFEQSRTRVTRSRSFSNQQKQTCRVTYCLEVKEDHILGSIRDVTHIVKYNDDKFSFSLRGKKGEINSRLSQERERLNPSQNSHYKEQKEKRQRDSQQFFKTIGSPQAQHPKDVLEHQSTVGLMDFDQDDVQFYNTSQKHKLAAWTAVQRNNDLRDLVQPGMIKITESVCIHDEEDEAKSAQKPKKAIQGFSTLPCFDFKMLETK